MKKEERKRKVRTKLRARSQRPRLSVFISNKHIYAQIIDDKVGETLVWATDKEFGGGKTVELAKKIGAEIAKKAKEKKIKEVVFDRGNYKYHGRIEALAQTAREGGLSF